MRNLPNARSLLLLVTIGALLSAGCDAAPASQDSGPRADSQVDTGPTDGGAGVDAAVPCGASDWITYGHDARRSFATDACVPGALTMSWRYDPMPPAMQTTTAIFHAIATSQGAFLQWRASSGMFLGTTAVDRVSPAGTRVWTFDNGTDTNLGNWASLALGSLVVEDDGLYFIDPATGTRQHDMGVDWWGQTAPAETRLYVVQNAHIDGPGLFVGAVDMAGMPIWQANQYGMCRIDATDLNGAIAVDAGTLFYASAYMTGTGVTLPFASGLYAFDGAMGTMRWARALTPSSAISAGDGHVYLIEDGMRLVARNQSDGTVDWMATVPGASVQAPVLAGSLVVVAGASGITAYRAVGGAMAWTSTVRATAVRSINTFSGGCAGLVMEGGPIETTMAAAMGSGTLVVTDAMGGITVLGLADGAMRWHGAVSGATGTLHDPVLVGDTVYVLDGDGLISLRAM